MVDRVTLSVTPFVGSVLGAGETVVYGLGATGSAALTVFSKIKEQYHLRWTKNTVYHFAAKKELLANWTNLVNRVSAAVLGLFTIIYVGGIYRSRQAKREKEIAELLDQNNPLSLVKAQNLGSAEASFRMAQRHTKERGIDKPNNYLKLAALKGHLDAKIFLGLSLSPELRNPDSKVKEEDVRSLYEYAALRGSSMGLCALSNRYWTTDKDLAVYLIKEAAKVDDYGKIKEAEYYLFQNELNKAEPNLQEKQKMAIKFVRELHEKGNVMGTVIWANAILKFPLEFTLNKGDVEGQTPVEYATALLQKVGMVDDDLYVYPYDYPESARQILAEQLNINDHEARKEARDALIMIRSYGNETAKRHAAELLAPRS